MKFLSSFFNPTHESYTYHSNSVHLSSLIKSPKERISTWEISGNGLAKSSYVFGTVHTVSYKLVDSFPQLKTLLNQCNFGLFEKGGNTIGNVKDTVIISPPLDSVFTPSEYAMVDDFFTKSSFGSIKPHNNDASLSAILQVVLMLNGDATKNQDMFFDEYLQQSMIDLKKNTFQLDEMMQMAKSAKKDNNRAIAEAIVYFIKNDPKNAELMTKAIFDLPLYRKSLTSDMKLKLEVTNQAVKEGTIERNLIWLPKIITKMKEGSCFTAVGLGHLQYKTGLIELLRKEGYQLKPITLSKIK